ncbi:15420_t:CDS:2 [Dentiscutata heterogama]|uniref:15420_t:CDS:1 n=1 Tax=Dentiscutata heterogama TaxID=1316150 RepID=A0ACA9KIL6_9GLOM|nr:15420_t:CDS:2 [Dentiscutata heterogama]
MSSKVGVLKVLKEVKNKFDKCIRSKAMRKGAIGTLHFGEDDSLHFP